MKAALSPPAAASTENELRTALHSRREPGAGSADHRYGVARVDDRGFLRAVRRLNEAISKGNVDPMETFVPLFETLHWCLAAKVESRFDPEDDAERDNWEKARAIRFARNRGEALGKMLAVERFTDLFVSVPLLVGNQTRATRSSAARTPSGSSRRCAGTSRRWRRSSESKSGISGRAGRLDPLLSRPAEGAIPSQRSAASPNLA